MNHVLLVNAMLVLLTLMNVTIKLCNMGERIRLPILPLLSMRTKLWTLCVLLITLVLPACTAPTKPQTANSHEVIIAFPTTQATSIRLTPTRLQETPTNSSCQHPSTTLLESTFEPQTHHDFIAFTSGGLQIVDLNTRAITRIYSTTQNSTETASKLVWSPDGRRIAFIHGNTLLNGCTDGYLAMADLSTGKLKLLSSTPRNFARPAWSPDGKQIATIDVDGGQLITINIETNEESASSYVLAAYPLLTWMDANRIAYLRETTRDGKSTTDLVAQDPSLPSYTTLAQNVQANEFALASNGEQLAYYAGSLRVVDLRNGSWVSLSPEPAERLQWSPDNRYLLFKGGMAGLFLAQFGVSSATQLSMLGLPAPAQAWFADSRRISILVGAEEKLPQLGIVDVSTQELQVLPINVYPPYDFAVNPHAKWNPTKP